VYVYCKKKQHILIQTDFDTHAVTGAARGKVKVKVNVDLYSALCRDHTSKALRYGTRSQGISQFYTCTPRVHPLTE